MTAIIDGSLGITAPTYGGTVTAEYSVPVTAFKNRIINGAMAIDQRNAGASVTPSSGNTYTIDRWFLAASQASKVSIQQSSTAPTGFTKSLKITSLSAYSIVSSDYFCIAQKIEGYNIADLGFGTANAKTFTISFWVQSSLTGTFGAVLLNGSENYSYPFTYTISAANTWEQKTVTITAPTGGTWFSDNSPGIELLFGLGVGSTYNGTAGSWSGNTYLGATGATSVVGTNGATFYITGVQLEKGSTATSFDYRPYGTELQLCQRYYYYVGGDSTYNYFGIASITSTTAAFLVVYLPVTMRSSPTLSYVGTVGNFDLRASGNAQHFLTAVSQDQSSTKVCGFALTTSGLTANTPGILIPNNSAANQLTFNAEL